MERRRRALGLKNPNTTPKKIDTNPSKQPSTSGDSSKSNPEVKINIRDKASQKQPTGSVTPKHKPVISHRNVTPLKPESPCSPLQSPGCLMVFPGTLGSPEIEVSWDWSCSQVPKDMLPPKRVKRVKTQLPVLSTLSMRPRVLPALQHQITEEENQQRLEYYKNILSMKPLKSNSEVVSNSTNNNIEDVYTDHTEPFTTPKRHTTRLSASKKRDEECSLFDDSANEFMFECSQAIEEKLKSGEIDMGPIVDIKIPQAKRPHSPGVDKTNIHKKTCHGRVNLFPERSNSKDISSEDNVNNNDKFGSSLPLQPNTSNKTTYQSNLVPDSTIKGCCNKVGNELDTANLSSTEISKPSLSKTHSGQNLERRSLTKLAHSVSHPSSNNHRLTSHKISTEMFQKNVNITNVDQFHQHQNGNNNKRLINPPNVNNNVGTNQRGLKRGEHFTSNQLKEMQRPKDNYITQDKSNIADVKSLLDDEFDLELSCLDVDSLCHRTENKPPQIIHGTFSAPKLCTQQEIEAKRIAALQKLKMKKNR